MNNYISLSRRWRPRTFQQIIGQEHINKILLHSLEKNKIHHAYLFTGSSGVGKTTIARLLAKSISCKYNIKSNPCLICDICQDIENNRFLDFIEVDGASKTKIEDIRDLLENIIYPPVIGKYKIYLIDEVHMLSNYSFNALLKILEEPPIYVKFLFATTDYKKLPPTILSRCIQLNLKKISQDLIVNYIKHILEVEKFSFDYESLELLARLSEGNIRNVLSMLDKIMVSCKNNNINISEVNYILGLTNTNYTKKILQSLFNLDAKKIIEISKNISKNNGNFKYILKDVLSYFHKITIKQCISESYQKDSIIELFANKFCPEDIQLFYQIGIKSMQDIDLAPSIQIGFEMTLLRMLIFKPTSKECYYDLYKDK